MFFKRMMNNVEKKFNEQQHKSSNVEKQVKEGETIIDKTPNQSTRSNNDVGEYIDYEDVE
jgi:septal ring factor EnvC (AmiA/AmiB activator)